ncbi:MAG: isoleucine--tRNA ligase [Candidatus Komeilibacteria bacterium]|nr:isoleucine--tRNA ligase [Candidatus Komeilibacteria bacterium]
MLNFPSIEEEILKYWQDNDIFQKTLKKDSSKGDFVFYDGPPFATGLPHYGHIVASLMKDIVPRFWTMQGYHVDRKWGWDCHGLPIENIVEQELGLKHKKDIETLGVAKFNELCETKVLKYAVEWRAAIDRLGRWVDMDNDYKTMDKNFMESVWWAFKQLWDKDLIYEGYRSMHICPRCETTLSQSEVGQGYKDIEDISVTVKFELVDEPGTFVLAWTTTPWTLPGNAALAVGEDVDYVKVTGSELKYLERTNNIKDEEGPKYIEHWQVGNFILAKTIFDQWSNKDEYQILEEFKGKKLVGKKYQPLFDYFDNDKLENRQNAFKIYSADFVSTMDGTGIVHIAPGFGDDDFNLSKKENIPLIKHIGLDGRLIAEVKDFAGEPAKPKGNHTVTDKKIVEFLEAKGLVFSSEKYLHSYPHCWRCDSPLLNYTTSSYFVAVEKIKTQLLKQAVKINWMPAHIKEGRFGKWLAGARDWSISRQRYWGSVLPIWVCAHCGAKKVFGSIEELEKASGREVDNLHKQAVDLIAVPCQKCKIEMKRIPDVLDCWFESGSMPYAQLHYPFENKAKFEANFPAQFIAEGADQTRAWFYYLHVLAVGILGKAAFKNVAVNGIVLASDGKKMSKKLKNYPDPMAMFNKYGADAMRYYLAISPVLKADDLCFSEQDLATVYKKVFIILGNVVSFYKMYEPQSLNSENKNLQSDNILDQWILAKLALLNKEITEAYKNYDLNAAARPLAGFIDELSTWYLRRSRERFKGDDEEGKQNALATFKYVLFQLALLMAPVMPFTAEYLYKELGGQKESVHLEQWPEANESMNQRNRKTLAEMEAVRKIVELALAKRDEAGIKVRQILGKLTVAGASLNEELTGLIKDEVNIKEVVYVKAEKLSAELDTVLTIQLKTEGLYRELVRTVNQLRKEAKLTINDRVIIYYQTDSAEVKEIFTKYGEELLKNTLAKAVVSGRVKDGLIDKAAEINGHKIFLALK